MRDLLRHALISRFMLASAFSLSFATILLRPSLFSSQSAKDFFIAL